MIQKVKNIKVQSFTMIDMITGMVIMSIIISLVYYVFANISRQVSTYTLTNSKIIALNLLKSELDQKMIRAEKLVAIPNGFTIFSESSSTDYEYAGSGLVRSSSPHNEVIYDNISGVSYQLHENTEFFNNDEELITGVTLDVLVGTKQLKLYFFKNYTNQEKINFSILNEIK